MVYNGYGLRTWPRAGRALFSNLSSLFSFSLFSSILLAFSSALFAVVCFVPLCFLVSLRSSSSFVFLPSFVLQLCVYSFQLVSIRPDLTSCPLRQYVPYLFVVQF